jgi:DNA repair photolyase
VDVLAELARTAVVGVSFTVTTLDQAVWRAIEPGTPPPRRRLEIMERLVTAGVPCGVYLAPILPGITDSAASLEEVAAAARAHGAAWLWASPLRLAPLVKEHYLGVVAASFPDLLPRYQRAYPRSDAPPRYRSTVQERIDQIRARHGFASGTAPRTPTEPRDAPPAVDERPRQLGLLPTA